MSQTYEHAQIRTWSTWHGMAHFLGEKMATCTYSSDSSDSDWGGSEEETGTKDALDKAQGGFSISFYGHIA